MGQENLDLQVEVHRLGNHYVAITKDGLGHQILRNEFHYQATNLTYLGPLWLIDQEKLVPEEQGRLGRLLKGNSLQTQATIRGQRLFQHLFGDGRVLKNHLTQHRDQKYRQSAKGDNWEQTCRLILSFSPDAASLERLPWEYLHDSEQFPCLDGYLTLSRWPLDVAPLATTATSLPLRLLLIVAAPKDQVALDVEVELGIVQDALESFIRSGTVEVDLLPEPTPSALLEALRAKPYDIVHFIGHGIYHLPQHQGYLCFEDELGRTSLVSGTQLPRFIEEAMPNLFITSACQAAQVGVLDAFQSVAYDLLHHACPGILAIPAKLSASSAIAFYRSIFGELVKGEAVSTGLLKGRWALRDAGQQTNKDERREDWGLPVFYQRAHHLNLVQKQSTDASRFQQGGRRPEDERPQDRPTQENREKNRTPVQTGFLTGRHREIQAARKAIAADVRIFYILGRNGVGKHTFASYLLNHSGTKPNASLTINCRETPEPLSSLAKIATFWRTEMPETGLEAAECLLDNQQPPKTRAQQAQALVARKRYVILFENIEAWFSPEETTSGSVESEVMRGILTGLISEPGRALFIFTGSLRWKALLEIPADDQREIRLPHLSERYAIHLINQLPTLRKAVPTCSDKQTLYRQLGGHPKTLQVLDRWLAFDNDLASLETLSPENHAGAADWLKLLTGQLLDHLDPGEYAVLRALSILRQPFNARTISGLTQVTNEHAQPLIDAWLHLGLVDVASNGHENSSKVSLAVTVRDCLLDGLSKTETRALHKQAADYYGVPCLEAARRQLWARNITAWSEERIGWLARDTNGILGPRLREAQAPEAKEELLTRALAWRHHLLEAGENVAASQIAQTLTPELDQQGQLDLSRKLLHQTLPTHTGAASHQEVDTLTKLRLEQGPLSAALRVYEEVCESLDADTAGIQRGYVLLRAGHVKQRLGDLEGAIERYNEALQITRREKDKSGEAECLYHLATAYRETKTLKKALVCSQAAKEHYQALSSALGEAATEREQGLILKDMDRTERALERFVASLRICRRIGDQQGIASNLSDIGRLFDKLGKTDVAIQVIEEAIQHDEHLKSPQNSDLLSLLEEFYRKQERVTEAITRFRTSRHRF